MSSEIDELISSIATNCAIGALGDQKRRDYFANHAAVDFVNNCDDSTSSALTIASQVIIDTLPVVVEFGQKVDFFQKELRKRIPV